MSEDNLEKLRLRKGERRSIRADVCMTLGTSDSKMGRAALAVQDGDGGAIYVVLPEKSLGDIAMGVLGTVHAAQTAPDKSKKAEFEIVARLIPVARLQVLDPSTTDAPLGHAVLELYVGTVPLRFSAPAEMFKKALEVAGAAGVAGRKLQ